jgi:cobalt-zinc-cadmium efflux system protein
MEVRVPVHSHNHAHHGTKTVLLWSLLATGLFVVLELWMGLAANSLALLSDAGHNFTDALALLLALFGVWLQTKPADDRKTYGYHRGGVLAAFVNALTLLVLAVWLIWESWDRLLHPRAVDEWIMIAVAGVGLAVNVGIMLGLRRTQPDDLNIRAAMVHMLGDALGSIAIIIGAICIRYTGWMAVDPVLSILISLLILWSGIDIVREALNILLEGLPKGMELQAVTDAMRQVPGVLDVHHLHVWSLASTSHALSCHALIADVPPSQSNCILKELNEVLAERFHIHHSTIQFEHQVCALSENGCNLHAAEERAHDYHSHAH